MCDFLDIFFILSLLARVIKICVSFLLYKIKQIQCKKKKLSKFDRVVNFRSFE
jgi:hypothetical protein